jgi:glutamyl-Q tRNA(Asp) synthetase
LHLGSLYTAAASYLDARANGGRWLLRIEDLDRPREVAGLLCRDTRDARGLRLRVGRCRRPPKRTPGPLRRGARAPAEHGLLFDCSCSRQDLADEDRYPGTCRERPRLAGAAMGSRLRVEPRQINFIDRIQGQFRQDVAAACGDLLLKRRDQIYAYVLAVVVDDADTGVTHVLRGADLLDNTPRQIYLQQALGLPTPPTRMCP